MKKLSDSRNWTETLVDATTPILRAIETINRGSLQVALVVDDARRLIGMITDGDVRRAILGNMPLDKPVDTIMTRNFTTASTTDSDAVILRRMRERDLRHIPVLDEQGRIVDLKVLLQLVDYQKTKKDNWVVLMAGGMGTRLRPLTEDAPKPMLKVGGKPILETIIKNFRDHRFSKFFISINYKAEKIEEYFRDGQKWGIEVDYIKEAKELGTAGALSLLPERPKSPIFVMNSDLLTKVNFDNLLNFHIENGSSATMCVREFDFQVPYGVVQADQTRLIGLEEKPIHKFFVNAGIYVLEPDVLDLIPEDSFFDMPSLFEDLLLKKYHATIFPIHEYWIDIGRMGDYKRANGEFCEYFQE